MVDAHNAPATQAEPRKRPDFNAMTRDELLSSFAASVDKSDFTGQGDKRHPHATVALFATRGEVNAAIAQAKGTESLDLADAPGRRKSVVDSLRTFLPAVRVPEYTKSTKEVRGAPTGRVLTGIAGLEDVSAGFGKSSSRNVGIDRDAAKVALAAIPERADVQEAVLTFRSAQAESINRKKAIDKAKDAASRPVATRQPASRAEAGR